VLLSVAFTSQVSSEMTESKGHTMAFSAPRLTIYALLSSVEEDLRGFTTDSLPAADPAETLGIILHDSAQRRYVDENGQPAADLPLETLLPYVDLGDLVAVLYRFRDALPKHVRRQLRDLTPQLQLLLPIRKRIAHVRPFRYDDLARVTSFCDQVSAQNPSSWPSVTETVAKLARDPAFVFDLPQPRYEEPPNSAYNNLPMPDYDDTGFLGREQEVATVIALCKGPWPVISLVGEGGLGKTALALRCAYDLLDDINAPYDAIVWSSSKTTRLDPTQIRDIDGAIRDSLGLLESIARELGSPVTDDTLVDEVVTYLESFRVLLILDNLETVLDDRIRGFLRRLPPGSKILITSRIGIGEYEYRVSVQPLPNVDAARLLRTFAKVSGVRSLAILPEDRLATMCDRMQNNPLFIKWFVSAVQVGVAPEEMLVDPGLFLDFCMSNVYEHLSMAAQDLLKALLASPDEVSLPELIYFNHDDIHETQGAVQELLTTNMLAMNSVAAEHGSVVETRYRLTELTRLYLTRHHPLTTEEDRDLERARRHLAEQERRISREIAGDQYDERSIGIRSRSDLLVVKALLDALRYKDNGSFAEALDCVLSVKERAPDYYECFRVEGQVHGAARNVAVAEAAFQTALGLTLPSAPLFYFYAKFLREVRHEFDGALEYLDKASALDPNAPHLVLDSVRCHLELLAFSSARAALNDLLIGTRVWAPHVERDLWRLQTTFHVVLANFATETKDYLTAIAALEGLMGVVETCPPTVASAVRESVPRALGAVWCCINESNDEGIQARARGVLLWLQGLKGLRLPHTALLAEGRGFGEVKFVDQTREFGFISSTDHGEIFFRRSSMDVFADFQLLKPGVPVSYLLGASERGRRAIHVRLE
jgi:LuxR family glucitol operon transcriptional activator